MDRATIDPIRSVLTEFHSKLNEGAYRKSRRGLRAGGERRQRRNRFDIEQLIYEAGRLQDAASLVNRLSPE